MTQLVLLLGVWLAGAASTVQDPAAVADAEARVAALLAKSPHPARELVDAWRELAEQQELVGAAESSLRSYEQCLLAIEDAEGPCSESAARSASWFGAKLAEQGRLESAIAIYERSIEAFESLAERNWAAETDAWTHASIAFYLLDRYSEARRAAQSALDLAERHLGPHSALAFDARESLAEIEDAMGESERSRRTKERMLDDLELTFGPNDLRTANARVNLAEMLPARESERAQALVELAIAELETLPEPDASSLLVARSLYADLIGARGDLAGAQAELERVLESQPSPMLELRVRNNLALLYLDQGRAAEAQAMLEQGVASARAELGESNRRTAAMMQNLAAIERELGHYERAWELCVAARRSQQATVAAYLPALSDAARLELSEFESGSVHSLLMLLPHTATSAHEAQAYAAVREWKGSVARSLAGERAWACSSSDPAVAGRLQRLERVQRRASHEVWTGAARTEEGRERLWKLADERLQLDRELLACADRVPRPAAESGAWHARLPKGTARIDFLVHDAWEEPQREGSRITRAGKVRGKILSAWVLRWDRDAAMRVELGDADALGSSVDALVPGSKLPERRLGRDASAASDPLDASRKLWSSIWQPLESRLEGIDTVVLAPDSLLFRLPFAVLQSPKGRFLIEDYAFVIAGERGPQGAHPDARESAPSLLLLGGLDYGNGARAGAVMPARSPTSGLGSIEDLPGTLSEIERVRAVFASCSSGTPVITQLSGTQGTEGRLRAELGKHTFVHLATHGLYLGESATGDRELAQLPALKGIPGLFSAIACAGVGLPAAADADDGLLTAEEFTFLDLSRVELVVLSGCRTALGATQSGEPPVGLASVLLQAGARSAMASIWNVPDAATVEFMEAFYRQLWSRGLAPSSALRAAQLEVLTRNRERSGAALPSTWGGFVLVGGGY